VRYYNDIQRYLHSLLPPSRYGRSLTKKEFTCSSISFYWSINRKVPELDAHNLFLAEKYRESFDQIFNDHTLPDEPSFYVHVPSRVDSTAAPAGKDTLVVLIPTGTVTIRKETFENDKQKYQQIVKFARKMAIATIEKRTNIKNFASLIENEICNDPWTWNRKFNLHSGSILGLSHTIMQVLWFRPSIK
jgi:phytoene desaturase (3,4-didehydrolycopene-forming)